MEFRDSNILSFPLCYEIDNNFDSEKFIKMRLRVFHDGVNLNKSSFTLEVLDNAKGTIKNIPILANVIFDEDGTPQFGGHDMSYEPDKTKDGEYKIIYKETPIGLIPENCNYSVNEYDGRNYVFVDAYIWKGYSNYAEDIIERDKDIKISGEIYVDSFSYNAKEKVYNITDFRYTGVTFLNKDFGTGMKDALATTGTFEQLEFKEKFIMMMEELKSTLSDCNINTSKEGGTDDLSKDKKDFEEAKPEDETTETVTETETEEFKEQPQEENNPEQELEPEKFVKSFELSHSEIRYALYQLLAPVEVEDNEWYFIDQVYDDRFEYMNWEGTKIYRQFYIKDGDVVSFTDDRIELYQERLTKSEKAALDAMRSNYSLLEAELNELKTFKEMKMSEERAAAEQEIFEHFDKQLNGKEEYESLKLNSKDYDIDALEKECYFILGKFTANFSAKREKKVETIKLPVETTINDDSYCGGIIERYTKK